MIFLSDKFYHIYNRTNNDEALFRTRENYIYFLKKYRYYFDDIFETIAYCLMPTHFHFYVRVLPEHKPSDELTHSMTISKKIGIWLRSYTKAYNNMYVRHGNLFNQKTKSKIIDNIDYTLNIATYIHQNPIRRNLVKKAEDWEFSSYKDYIDLRNGTLPKKDLLLSKYSKNQIIDFTSTKLISDPAQLIR